MTRNGPKFPDLGEIDLNDWCKKLGCSNEQLMFCINSVGTSWVSVEAFWSMNKERICKTLQDQKLE